MKANTPINNRGAVLVWVMVSLLLISSAISVGISVLLDTNTVLSSQIEYYGQTNSIARAGIVDTLAWFRRQTSQPVVSFNPQRDMTATPPINDTDDASIGIVRELEVDGSSGIYGRYEVISNTVADVSSQRGLAGVGTMWYIESTGYIYLRLDQTKSYNVWPNRVIGSTTLGTEIRRVSMVLPGLAAICASNANQTVIGNNTKIMGGTGYGIVYKSGTGTPNIAGGAIVSGTPTAIVPLDPFNNTCEQIFGMSESELRSISDYYCTSVNDVPNPLPNYKIVFFEGNAVFNSTQPLKGTGIFYITGNMTIAANSGSAFNGIIYCKGGYNQNAPSIINGSVIGLGLINIQSTGDISEVDYDANILQQVRTFTGPYRLNKGLYKIN